MLLRKYFVPLVPWDPNLLWQNFKEHLKQSGYNMKQRADYQLARDQIESGNLDRLYDVAGHDKAEFQEEYKNPRMINARSLKYRALVGPSAHAMEQAVYSLEIRGHKIFIKHVPVAERAGYIMNVQQPGSVVYETDHSAFEAHMAPEIMDVCEIALYKYMLANVPDSEFLIDKYVKGLTGVNRSRHEGFKTFCRGRRMSGDMVTSLGNGFTNLCCAAWVMYRCGYNFDEYDSFFEGDDGLIQASAPVGERRKPTTVQFHELGFEVKMAQRTSIAESTFCTMVADEVDRQNIIDPAVALCKFGWTFAAGKENKKLHKSFLRAKALSLKCEAPGCPIVRALADFGLRVTKGVQAKFDFKERWWLEQVGIDLQLGAPKAGTLERADAVTIGLGSRYAMERLFGVPVCAQIKIETWLAGLNDIREFDSPDIIALMRDTWFNYYELHSLEV